MSSESDQHLVSIAELARHSGVSSRTLRHYDQIGLLPPSKTGRGGIRYYDLDSRIRLQRILLLRQHGLPLASIAEALADPNSDPVPALRAHLDHLHAQQRQLDRQAAAITATLKHLEEGAPLMTADQFDGFDNSQYQEEVEQRWGKQAWADGQNWWQGLTAEDKQGFMAEHQAIAAAWQQLHAEQADPEAEAAQTNAARHHAWIAIGWQGKQPSAEQLLGLADMYVADPRFAENYGGEQGASYVRAALRHYALTNLD